MTSATAGGGELREEGKFTWKEEELIPTGWSWLGGVVQKSFKEEVMPLQGSES